MRTSRTPERLVVDANPILSALLGGAASRVFFSENIAEFAVTQEVLAEVERYLPVMAKRLGVRDDLLEFAFRLLPLSVYPVERYRGQLRQAERRIGQRDPDDVDSLALALALDLSIWTNDRDFEGTGVELFSTADLLRLLGG